MQFLLWLPRFNFSILAAVPLCDYFLTWQDIEELGAATTDL